MTLAIPINDKNVIEVNNFPNITREEELRFQVYALVDPTTESFYHPALGTLSHSPFYIGKGCESRKRGHVYESSTDSNLPKDNKLRILLQSFTIDDIFVPLSANMTHNGAIDLEKQLIGLLGRRHLGGLLCNITAGGEGRAEPHTEEWKAAHSARMKGSQNPSAKLTGYLCHPTQGSYSFGIGQFNELCAQLNLGKEARKLLVGYIQSYKGYIFSERPMSIPEIEARISRIQLDKVTKFKAAMAQRRTNKNDNK